MNIGWSLTSFNVFLLESSALYSPRLAIILYTGVRRGVSHIDRVDLSTFGCCFSFATNPVQTVPTTVTTAY